MADGTSRHDRLIQAVLSLLEQTQGEVAEILGRLDRQPPQPICCYCGFVPERQAANYCGGCGRRVRLKCGACGQALLERNL